MNPSNLLPLFYHLIDSDEAYLALLKRLEEVDEFEFDIETDEEEWARKRGEPDELSNTLIGFSICPEEGEAYYIPTPDERREDYLSLLQPLLREKKVYIHYAKFEIKSLRKYSIRIRHPRCTFLMAVALGEETLGLKAIVKRNFNITMKELSDFIDMKKQPVSDIPLSQLFIYGCDDANGGMKWAKEAERRLEEQPRQKWYYENILMGLLPWAIEEELEGIEADEDKGMS